VVEGGDQFILVNRLEVKNMNRSSNLSLGKKRGIYMPLEIKSLEKKWGWKFLCKLRPEYPPTPGISGFD
jgi:hypothetical protein